MLRFVLILVIFCISIVCNAQTTELTKVDSLLQKGRYKKALLVLKNVPTSFYTNVKIASIYNTLDNYGKACVYYENALKLKDDYQTKISLGKSYKKQEQPLKAIKVFEDVVAEDKDNLLIKYQLGKLYLQTQKSKKAKQIFKELTQKDSENPNYSYCLGLAYKQLNKRNLKINSFLEAYRKDTTHFKSVEKLAKNFVFLHDKDSAVLFIDKGLKLRPRNINLNKLKINDLFIKKDYKNALKYLQNIDSLKANDYYAKKMLGQVYFQMDSLEKAKKYFKKAFKIDNTDFDCYTYLGKISLEQKDLAMAKMNFYLATFVGKDPRDEPYYELGKVFYKLKKPKKALQNFKKAVEESSKNRQALFELAKLSDDYYKDKKIAYELYKKYLNYFENLDKKTDVFVKNRLSAIKEKYFLKGKRLD